jgi:hypothetical protein
MVNCQLREAPHRESELSTVRGTAIKKAFLVEPLACAAKVHLIGAHSGWIESPAGFRPVQTSSEAALINCLITIAREAGCGEASR